VSIDRKLNSSPAGYRRITAELVEGHLMPSRSRTLAVAVIGVGVLVAGCAATIAGTAARDTSAATAFTPALPTLSTTGIRIPTSLSFNLPAPPTPTSASGSTKATTAPTSSVDMNPTRDTSANTTAASSGGGVNVDRIIGLLGADPLYVDTDAKKFSNTAQLQSLRSTLNSARSGGLQVNVALIGHEIDDLTGISDAISKRTGATSIVVSPSHFAVSSDKFSSAQLQQAEQSASTASVPADAASKLITALKSMYGTGKTTARSTRTTTAATASTAPGAVLTLDRFQLPDGSIACAIQDDTIRCDVRNPTYKPPTNPHPNCAGDYGNAIMMTATAAPTFICVSDTVADPSLPKFANGETTQVGNVMCFSTVPAVTCANLASGHGFTIQPDQFQIF
jgi:hypothetical protein